MLNNNAELDNGVYNENDEKPQEEEAKGKSLEKGDDGLMGLNMDFLCFNAFILVNCSLILALIKTAHYYVA